MDFATLIGLIGGIAIITTAMSVGSDIMLFVSIPSLMVVLGGTSAAILIKFPFSHCLNGIKIAIHAFRYESSRPRELISIANELSSIARKNGFVALEDYEVSDPFFKKGIQLLADGQNAEFIRNVLTQEMEHSVDRHEIGQRMFRSAGDAAPAFGMIGTIVGLVQMLSTLSDPDSIGPAMAVALLTTLYGALIANLIAIPIADKLEFRSMQESLNQSLIIEGITSIQQGQNPRIMDELLESYLPHRQRPSAESPVAGENAQQQDEKSTSKESPQ
jgi:chemotaxis protein MotA